MLDERCVALVVDDEVGVRNLIELLLSRYAATVLSAADGREALEISRTYPERIDVVITDVMLPGVDGVQTALQIVRERPEIRVLLITGRVMNPVAVAQTGFAVLNKPFTPNQFHAALAKVLADPPPHVAQDVSRSVL